MDYFLDIVLPAKEVMQIALIQRLIEWDHGIYPCDPPQYFTGSGKIADSKPGCQRVGAQG